MPAMLHYDSVDAYIAAQPEELQPKLQKLRETIRKAAPMAEEGISYSMPAFKYLKRPLVYFAACKAHIGFYPQPKAIEMFRDQLSPYEVAKGTIRFALDKPLPMKLIRDLVKFRMEENKAVKDAKMISGQQKSITKKAAKAVI